MSRGNEQRHSEIWSVDLCGPSSPLLSHVGFVPVHSCERVQVLCADPARLYPPRQEKLCVVPGWNHCSLGQKFPFSSWSWAGHSFSGGGRVQRELGRHYNTYCMKGIFLDQQLSKTYLYMLPMTLVCH